MVITKEKIKAFNKTLMYPKIQFRKSFFPSSFINRIPKYIAQYFSDI